MASVATTTSSTIVALLSTVNSTATSVAKVIDTAASSVDMLDRYVQRAKNNQIKANKIADKDYVTNLVSDASEAQSMRMEQLERKLSGNVRLQQLYLENHAEYMALLAD